MNFNLPRFLFVVGFSMVNIAILGLIQQTIDNDSLLNGNKLNALRLNGIQGNGLTFNGIQANGITLNGTDWNQHPTTTATLEDKPVEAITLEGSQLVLHLKHTNP